MRSVSSLTPTLRQIAFTISAFKRPGKMPESLAALGLVQSAASTFAWSVYEMVSRTQNIEEQLEAVRGVYALAEIPNLVPDGTLSFPEKGESIEAGIALEFRSVLEWLSNVVQVLTNERTSI